MSDKDRDKWNVKYRQKHGDPGPSDCLVRHWHRVLPGPALDIACGNGRNSLFLAQKGFRVDSVDISDIAVERLRGRHPGILPRRRDLDDWEIPLERYRLIVNTRFLDRRLFPQIREGLLPGGLLVFESFLEGTEGKNGVPHNRAYLLRPNELLHAFIGLHILFYEERAETRDGLKSCMATLVAKRHTT